MCASRVLGIDSRRSLCIMQGMNEEILVDIIESAYAKPFGYIGRPIQFNITLQQAELLNQLVEKQGKTKVEWVRTIIDEWCEHKLKSKEKF